MAPETFYTTIGILEGATLEEIKARYRVLAKKYHPDLNGGSLTSANAFKRITVAYETLRDPHKRQEYDRELRKLRAAAAGLVAARENAARDAATRQAATREAAARAASLRASGPTPGQLLGGLGFLAILAAAFGGSSSTWDPSVNRFRDSDGRFAPG